MTAVQILQDGVVITVDSADPNAPRPEPVVATVPRTVFDPATLITTLFTPAEQVDFMSHPQGILFATLIAAERSIDITAPSFRAYLEQAVAGGFLTQARADQVLTGTTTPQGA